MEERTKHTQDSDCLVSDKTGLCLECGVHHGDPCLKCSGRGFHNRDCEYRDELPGEVVEPFNG